MNLDNTKDFCGGSWKKWAQAETVFKYIAETEEKVVKLSDAFIYRHCTGLLHNGEIMNSGEDVFAILNALEEDGILKREDDCYCTLYELAPEAKKIYAELAASVKNDEHYGFYLSNILGWEKFRAIYVNREKEKRAQIQSRCKSIDIAEMIDKCDVPHMDELHPHDKLKANGEYKEYYYTKVLDVFAERLIHRDENGRHKYKTLDSVKFTVDSIYCLGVNLDEFEGSDSTYINKRGAIFETLVDLWKANIVMEWDNAYILKPTYFMWSAIIEYEDEVRIAREKSAKTQACVSYPTLYEVIRGACNSTIAHKDEASEE